MLLCILILGVGGSFVAININQVPLVKPVPAPTPALPTPAPTPALPTPTPTPTAPEPVPTPIVKYDLSVSVNPPGSGTVSPDGGTYDTGTQVTVIAIPLSGYRFDCWSGHSSSTNPTITVTMNSNKSVVANFTTIHYSLSTSVSPPGSGTISPSSGSYDSGTQVTLTATPSSAWRFDHWSGAEGTSRTITLIMDSNKSVTASFTHVIYTLTTSVNPAGSGTISPSSGSYEYGELVTLTASPSSSYIFDYWGGDTSGSSGSTGVTMNSDKNIIAYFEKLYQTFTYTMPGLLLGSSVSYSKQLTAGERVDGFVELTGQDYGIDWSYKWHFQILGPGGESIHDWGGHWVNTPHHDFNFTPSYTGKYTIRVSHASSYSKNLVIQIWPPGWGYSGKW